MADFVEVPAARLPANLMQALLEEYASRDGTDYGELETSLEHRVSQLRVQLERGDLRIVYDTASEQWDILSGESARQLLAQETVERVDEG